MTKHADFIILLRYLWIFCIAELTSEIVDITIMNLQHKVVNSGVSPNFKANVCKRRTFQSWFDYVSDKCIYSS